MVPYYTALLLRLNLVLLCQLSRTPLIGFAFSSCNSIELYNIVRFLQLSATVLTQANGLYHPFCIFFVYLLSWGGSGPQRCVKVHTFSKMRLLIGKKILNESHWLIVHLCWRNEIRGHFMCTRSLRAFGGILA